MITRVDLGPLPYRQAMELVHWCAMNDIDRERALDIIESWSTVSDGTVDTDSWYLDIPDKYITYFVMKWSN